MNDDYTYNDPFGAQQTMTPNFNSFKTTGNAKLLVVIFVVDCSQTMAGERIQAVNAALREVKSTLQEIKVDNGLDLKIAIMSFTSNARWDLKLTDIDEVTLENLSTRPGLTEYGTAFHELNKVLCKEEYMKHTGKIAPPAIMFLTDGEPTDDYQADLEDLLKNGWFANASRSAVLLGDAIHNDKARNAVSRFVEDPDNDIVAADNSTVIMHKIKIATMHTVAGAPISKRNDSRDTDSTAKDRDVKGSGTQSDPFGGSAGNSDPFGGSAGNPDPFSGSAGNPDPFGGSSGDPDPFGGSTGGFDPFASNGGDDPFSDMA